MADRGKRDAAKQARRSARRRKAHQRRSAETAAQEAPLVEEVREALASGVPIDLLGLVSMVIVATAPQQPALLSSEQEAPPSLDELVAAFIELHVPETTALLSVLGELLDDDAVRDRCRREVEARDDQLPLWLADLAQTSVDKVVRMTHVLGDGDELLLHVRLPGGQAMTCCVFVDHLSMSGVKDAFFVPDTIDAVLAVAKASNTDPDTSFVDMSPADARVMLGHALTRHLAIYLPEESETWPATRPLVQWLTRLLPIDASNSSVGQQDSLSASGTCEQFFASPAGMGFDQRLYESILLACMEEGTGDPLRWSAARLTQLLDELSAYDESIPLQIQLAAPELLRAFVPFAHATSGIRQELTAEALATIDEYADSYRAAVLAESESESYFDDDEDRL